MGSENSKGQNFIDKVLGNPLVYSLWSSGVDAQKQAAIKRLLPPLNPDLRVLDLGCGPATNTSLFARCRYTGVDVNAKYVDHARRLNPDKEFLLLDVTMASLGPEMVKAYDIVLVSSFLHHLDDRQAFDVITAAHSCLDDNGLLIINEPLRQPMGRPLRFILMKLDRGDYFRSREEYCSLVQPLFRIELEETYPLRMFGINGWSLLAMRLVRLNTHSLSSE